ncbi:MAG TPA: putative peptidoglycan glycosyltransferase FtsW, partial [Geobacteraceae bacterium]|nr:putative peptidoglycan glycosyltransferase FtsW [Geobacteraceae bacterium]
MAVALTCFGVVMVYSASSVMAVKKFHDGFYFLKRQGLYALLGFTVMGIAMATDYEKWRKYAVPILLGTMVLLVLVFVPGIGGAAKGASRWIRLPGFNFQPSELAKIALIFYMAYSLDKKQEKVKFFSTGFLPYMVLLAVLIGLLLKQRDMGAALTLGSVAILMLFAAGTRPRYILGMGVLALPFACYLVLTESYRLRRIKAFLDPWQDPTDSGFQIIQSWLAFGNGGILGQGLGEGKQKLFYLPEAHTDFILSVIGEELGVIG